MLDLSIASSGGDAQSGASPEQAPVPTTVRLVDLLHKPPQQRETEQAFVIIVSGQTHRLERPTSDLCSSSSRAFFFLWELFGRQPAVLFYGQREFV